MKSLCFFAAGWLLAFCIGWSTDHLRSAAALYGSYATMIAFVALFLPQKCSRGLAHTILWGGTVWIVIAAVAVGPLSEVSGWAATFFGGFVALMFIFGGLNMIPYKPMEMIDESFFGLIPNPPAESRND